MTLLSIALLCLSYALAVNVVGQNLCTLQIQRPSASGSADLCLLWSSSRGHFEAPTSTSGAAPNLTEIVLVTHLSFDRLDRLLDQAENWNGTTFASVLVENDAEIERLHVILGSRPELFITTVRLSKRQSYRYPVNLMRNVAVWTAGQLKAEWLLVLDVDAMPMQGWQDVLADMRLAATSNALGWKSSNIIYVLPAFELVAQRNRSKGFRKDEINSALRDGRAKIMHSPRPSYSFDLNSWMEATSGFSMDYRLMNEPYVVYRSQVVAEQHPFDERFAGRGFNKQSHHFELWASGHQYVVLSGSFLLDVPNPSTQSADSTPLKWVTETSPIWKSFRTNIAKRYNLECRESLWKICDEKSLHCEKVCSKAPTRPTESVLHIPPQSVEPYQARTGSWTAFERISNRRAEAAARGDTNRMPTISRQACLSAIDVVYTWVNGSDENHLKSRLQYIPREAFNDPVDVGRQTKKMKDHQLNFRFRDFGDASTLKFSMYSLLKHAPWVRNVHIVIADGQSPPAFVNLTSERIFIARHSSLMRADCLPTFNSCAIESKLHLIPNLSECFLYLNDDIMLIEDLHAEMYWPESEQVPRAVFDGNEAPDWSRDDWQRKLANVGKMLKIELDLSKVFLVGHQGHFMVKQVIKEIYELPGIARQLNRTECEKWRSIDSMWLPMIYPNALLALHSPKVMIDTGIYHAMTDAGGLAAIRKVLHRIKAQPRHDVRWLCLNDLLGAEVPADFIFGLSEELKQLLNVSPVHRLASTFFAPDEATQE